MGGSVILIFLVVGGIVFFFIFLYFVPINLWITAIFSGVQIDILSLVFMRIRRVPINAVVNALIGTHKAGIPIDTASLETHALAGGDVTKVANALIKAKSMGVETSFKELSGEDLAGNNLDEFLAQKKNQGQAYDTRTELCRKIMNELNEGQVKEVETFVGRF